MIFDNSEAWYCSGNGRQVGLGMWCGIVVLTICSGGKVTDDGSQLTHFAFTSILLERGTPEISCTTPFCFFLSAFLDMSKACPPRKLHPKHGLEVVGSDLGRTLGLSSTAQPRTRRRELGVAVKTHLLLVTRLPAWIC